MAELARALLGATLWLGVLLLFTVAANRARGQRELDPAGLLIAYPAFLFTGIACVKLLNLVFRLTAMSVALLYLLIAVAAVLVIRALPRRYAAEHATSMGPDDVSDVAIVRRVAMIVLVTTVGALALFALVTPVHIWDVQAYHMPMVASYVQNESLAPWPAQDLRQVFRVNGAELHMFVLAVLARSDAWVELTNVVALVVAFVAALHLARLVIDREILAWVAAALLLTAPQILLGSVTAKNDVVFMALVLCAFYWTIDVVVRPERDGRLDGGRPRSDPAQPEPAQPDPMQHAAARPAGTRTAERTATFDRLMPRLLLIGGICALGVATKVLGVNVLGAVGLVLLVFWLRRRVPLRAPVLVGVFALLGVLILVGDVYWQNFNRVQVPVGTMPGEIDYKSGLVNLIGAARFYVYDLAFVRLVTEQPFEHDFSHYGYFFPFLLVMSAWAIVRPLFGRVKIELASATLAMLVLLFFGSVIAVREPIQWDQRFMIWMVPTLAVLAALLLRGTKARYLLVLVSFVAAFALGNLFRTFTSASDGLFTRAARHLVAHGEPARLLDVPQRDYQYKIDGFARLDSLAAPNDSILYIGAEDTWMYPAWGRRFTRHVRGVDNAADATRQVGERVFRFVVVEDDATQELKAAVLQAAGAAGYADVVNADGRRVLERGDTR